MSETKLRRAGRAILSIHRTGLLVPAAGLAVMGVSAYAMVAVAQAFPETAFAPDGIGQCNPLKAISAAVMALAVPAICCQNPILWSDPLCQAGCPR